MLDKSDFRFKFWLSLFIVLCAFVYFFWISKFFMNGKPSSTDISMIVMAIVVVLKDIISYWFGSSSSSKSKDETIKEMAIPTTTPTPAPDTTI